MWRTFSVILRLTEARPNSMPIAWHYTCSIQLMVWIYISCILNTICLVAAVLHKQCILRTLVIRVQHTLTELIENLLNRLSRTKPLPSTPNNILLWLLAAIFVHLSQYNSTLACLFFLLNGFVGIKELIGLCAGRYGSWISSKLQTPSLSLFHLCAKQMKAWLFKDPMKACPPSLKFLNNSNPLTSLLFSCQGHAEVQAEWFNVPTWTWFCWYMVETKRLQSK